LLATDVLTAGFGLARLGCWLAARRSLACLLAACSLAGALACLLACLFLAGVGCVLAPAGLFAAAALLLVLCWLAACWLLAGLLCLLCVACLCLLVACAGLSCACRWLGGWASQVLDISSRHGAVLLGPSDVEASLPLPSASMGKQGRNDGKYGNAADYT
jgi:hypothetical protein